MLGVPLHIESTSAGRETSLALNSYRRASTSDYLYSEIKVK